MHCVSQLMKIRRRLTGMLFGFLDAFSSRHSDYDGYWIFGLLVRECAHVSFDLLNGISASRRSHHYRLMKPLGWVRCSQQREAARHVKAGSLHLHTQNGNTNPAAYANTNPTLKPEGDSFGCCWFDLAARKNPPPNSNK
jgi:hypothetical protein